MVVYNEWLLEQWGNADVVYNDGLMARSDDYIFIFIYEDLVLVFERTF